MKRSLSSWTSEHISYHLRTYTNYRYVVVRFITVILVKVLRGRKAIRSHSSKNNFTSCTEKLLDENLPTMKLEFTGLTSLRGLFLVQRDHDLMTELYWFSIFGARNPFFSAAAKHRTVSWNRRPITNYLLGDRNFSRDWGAIPMQPQNTAARRGILCTDWLTQPVLSAKHVRPGSKTPREHERKRIGTGVAGSQ